MPLNSSHVFARDFLDLFRPYTVFALARTAGPPPAAQRCALADIHESRSTGTSGAASVYADAFTRRPSRAYTSSSADPEVRSGALPLVSANPSQPWQSATRGERGFRPFSVHEFHLDLLRPPRPYTPLCGYLQAVSARR